jgi:hypothetical protein
MNETIQRGTRFPWMWLPALVAFCIAAYGVYDGAAPREVALALIVGILGGLLVGGISRVATKAGLPRLTVRTLEGLATLLVTLGMFRYMTGAL